jgi:hypothetical protein
MKILFAPSEGKQSGGVFAPLCEASLIFPELYSKRITVTNCYEQVVRDGNNEVLESLFGIKDSKEFDRYKISFNHASTMKAIERYDGVAYGYLNYASLSNEAKEYINQNTIIFSNLFGPISAGDCIPDYKLKQGSSIEGLAPEKYYKEHFSNALDEMLENSDVLDLRAGFYDKFYIPKKGVTTLKFLKEGKVVSHWAKAYRGVVLRAVAMQQVKSLEEFLTLSIDGLVLHEIIESKKKKEIVFTII